MNAPALTFQLAILFTGHMGGHIPSYGLLLNKGLGFIPLRNPSFLPLGVARDTSVFAVSVERNFLK